MRWQAQRVRAISVSDFSKAMRQVRASVKPTDLTVFEEWDRQAVLRMV
jgi:hypothetical protein